MITIEDGIPIIDGRRFPWAWKVETGVGYCRFALMLENGWTLWVYSSNNEEIQAHAYNYSQPGPYYGEITGQDFQSTALRPDEVLTFIDRVSQFPSSPLPRSGPLKPWRVRNETHD